MRLACARSTLATGTPPMHRRGDMPPVRLVVPASSSRAPARTPPVEHDDPTLRPLERDVLQLQRSAGNRAVAAAVQRQASPVVQREAAESTYKIISQVWQISGRDIVVVATGKGDQVLFFYRRTGLGDKGVGQAVEPGKWAPFKTLMAQDESIIGREIEVHSKGSKVRFPDPDSVKDGKPKHANPKKAWFNKQPYYSQVGSGDPLRGYANVRNQQVGQWLDDQKVPAGQVKHWETVEQEMDDVANRYRAQVRSGAGGGGAGGKAAGQAGAAEVKAAGAEAKAIGAEAKVAGIEAKAIKAETAAADVVAGAAKASKVARIGRLLMALALPGPHDVFFLFISAFASIAEAKAQLRADAFALGFAEGLAAVITWTDAEKAQRLLMYRVVTPSMGERVAGFEGVREHGNNDGVRAGWKFGQALSGDQRKGFRAMALEATGLKEKRHSSRDDLIRMGVALKPTVVELLAEAERQERAKQAAARAEAMSRRQFRR
jgi:hypothetical protein